MHASEELELPPWEKFRKYGYFPFKLCLHFILLSLVTSLVIILNASFSSYSRSIWISSVSILYPEDYTDFQSDVSSPYQYMIYTQQRTIIDANRLINQYFRLPNESVNNIHIYSPYSTSISSPYVKIFTNNGDSSYTLGNYTNDPDCWPLSVQNAQSMNLRDFFNNLKRMSFNFYVQSYGTSEVNSDREICYNWKWIVNYDLSSLGQIVVTTKADILGRCDKIRSDSTISVISTIILILAIGYQILLFKAMFRQCMILVRLRYPRLWMDTVSQRSSIIDTVAVSDGAALLQPLHASDDDDPSAKNERDRLLSSDQDHQGGMHRRSRQRSDSSTASSVVSQNANRNMSNLRWPSFDDIDEDLQEFTNALEFLTWQDYFRIINLWVVVATFGNLFSLAYSIGIVVYDHDTIATPTLKGGLGLSCFMYWFCLVQYLEFFPRYYIMISMLKITVPRVSQFLLGVLPVLIGYAFLGLICFGDMTDRFGNVTETFRTLFSVVNGDIIYDTFQALEFAGIGGQIYVYFYIILFTYVVLMTIIAIVEEAFFECQQKKSITNSTTVVHTTDSSNRPSERSSQPPSPSSNNPAMYHPPRQTSTESRNNMVSKNIITPNTTDEISNPASLSSKQSSLKSTAPGTYDDYRTRASSNASSVNVGVYDSTTPSMVVSSYDNNTTMGQSGGGINQSSPLGKRDLPDHLKYLLQRIPSNSNLASSGTNTASTSSATTGNVLHAMMPTSTNMIWNRTGSNRTTSTSNRNTVITTATSGSNKNTPDSVSPTPSWNSQILIDEEDISQ